MYWLKSCPRCYGDLSYRTDQYGRYIACVQCSHNLTEAEEARLGMVPAVLDEMKKVAL